MILNVRDIINSFKYKRKIKLCSDKFFSEFFQISKPFCTQVKPLPFNILFFGSDGFSLPSLDLLHANRNTAIEKSLGIVTSFKKPTNSVKAFAQEEKIPAYAWPIEKEVCDGYDMGIVVSFGHLIPERIIKALPLGLINVHASLLPKFRGAAPIIYAMKSGATQTGVSIMKVEPKHFDIGDIIAQANVSIDPHILLPAFYDLMAERGAQLLLEVLQRHPESFANLTKQNPKEATYAPKITPAVRVARWNDMNATQIYNLYRALYGFKYVTTTFRGMHLHFVELRLPTKQSIREEMDHKPGRFLYSKDRQCIDVFCANKTYIEVHKLRIKGKPVMNASEFNNGFLKKYEHNTMDT